MKRPVLVLCITVCSLCICRCRSVELNAQRLSRTGDLTLEVEATPTVAGVRRVGMNLGTWTSWGAEQYVSNVIKNPGFEGIVDRAIVIVKGADAATFFDDNEYLGRPDGFWAGAQYDIRTGESAGRSGSIVNSRQRGLEGYPDYTSDSLLPPIAAGDVIALTRVEDDELPTNWWFPKESLPHVGTAAQVRPGSPGRRSLALRLLPGRPTAAISYLDAIGSRAGKLLPLNGSWMLSFWCRREGGDSLLDVEVSRGGRAVLAKRTLEPQRSWMRTSVEFSAVDDGPADILELRFQGSGTGEILLDDVELRPATEESAFRREVVDALLRLRPAYLRDWQGQLGDTFANRIADPFERRASRYRPGGLEETQFLYSLPEFLELCYRVGANPWIIVPTTFSDEEFLHLGRFLAEHAGPNRFDEVLVEFGNENWNPLFRPAGIADPKTHAQVFDRAVSGIRNGAGGRVRILAVANGQHANPAYAIEVSRLAKTADVLAVAPYFMYRLDPGTPRRARLGALFSGDAMLPTLASAVRELGKDFGVYEVNLHTTEGAALEKERDGVTAGMASGSALAKRIIEGLSVGATRQCAYVLSGYDTWLPQINGHAKLWGMVRDLGPTLRFRPTGLAVVMLNHVLSGDLHRIRVPKSAPEITAVAFQVGQRWKAAIVSSDPQPRRVVLVFPPSTNSLLPHRLLRLDGSDPEMTNEDSANVSIVDEPITFGGNAVAATVPPWGFIVLTSSED